MDKDLEIAINKQRYNFYYNHRKNYSKRADMILEKIKNGYNPNDADVFEIFCDDEEQIKKYRYIFELKERVKDGYISYEDFYSIIDSIGINDYNIVDAIKHEYEAKGILVEDYNEKQK